MPVGMLMQWSSVGLEDYKRVHNSLDLDTQPVDGLLFHIAGAVGTDWRVVDIWESEDHFHRFVDERLMPTVQRVGLEAPMPDISFFPLANVYAPGAEALARMGGVAAVA